MNSPSPSPRRSLPSVWKNRSKTRSTCSVATPSPVSCTANSIWSPTARTRTATALGGELERVADEVRDPLEDPRRVERCRADSRFQRARQLEPARMRGRLEGLDRVMCELARIAGLGLHGELAGLDARDIHQVTDEAVHLAAAAADGLGVAHGVGDWRVRHRELLHEVRGEHDATQQAAEIVTYHRHEVLTGAQHRVGTHALELELGIRI